MTWPYFRRAGQVLLRYLAARHGFQNLNKKGGTTQTNTHTNSLKDFFFRNTGEIKGSLSHLQPFFLLAQSGSSGRVRRRRVREQSKGRFAIGLTSGDGCAFKFGVILPVSACRDESARKTLLSLRECLVSGNRYFTAKSMRAKAQAILDERFRGALKIDPNASLCGEISFERNRSLFRFFSKQFEYVEALHDNPNGLAKPLILEPFRWPSYGEFMEWFNEGIEDEKWYWAHCDPYLVFDKTCLFSAIDEGTPEVERCSLDPSRFFTVAEEIMNERVSVRFEMSDSGWAYLHLGMGGETKRISLSDVFPPFYALVAWLKMLDRDDIPARFHIDEEGEEKTLAVYSTNDAARVLLRVTDRYTDEMFLEGIVAREQLLEEFKQALRDFFQDDFDPEQWREDEPEELGFPSLHDRMINDGWLFWSRKPPKE